jgi:small subunit ribosomal protein S6
MSKRKYESLIVINTKGKEDSIDGMISEIGKQMEEEGVRLEQVDRIGRR